MKKGNKDQESVMVRLATFVVDKRNLFFLLVIIGTIFTLFSRNWVQVENDLSSYLPIHSTTRQGLDVMEEQFTTFGTADLMVANISLEEARRVKAELLELDGVQSVEFDDTTDHYAHASALYSLPLTMTRTMRGAWRPWTGPGRASLAGMCSYPRSWATPRGISLTLKSMSSWSMWR